MIFRRIAIAMTVAAFGALMLGAGSADAATVGSLAPAGSPGGCGACTSVQKSTKAGTPSYVFPADGIVTSFSVQIGSTVHAGDFVRLFAFEFIASSSYYARVDSGNQPLDASMAGKVVSFPTRLKVKQGQLLGMEINASAGGNTTWEYTAPGSDATDHADGFSNPPALNVNTSAANAFSSTRLNIQATLEPDIDGDGYGDLTQDLCTNDSTIQTACPLPPDVAAPVITQFKTLYKRFRIKPKGAVIAKRAHPGTTISMNLSEPATVAFTVTKLFRGKITKGICKKAGQSNRKNHRCTKTIVVHTFSVPMATGHNEFFYSGRYYDAKQKIGTLRPGPYRIGAVATDAAGNASLIDYLAFKVRR